MARYQTSNFTSSSVSAGSSLAINRTGLPNYFNILKLKVVPNTGGSARVEIYKNDGFSTKLCYKSGSFTGSLIAPRERDTGLEREEAFVLPYEDEDATGELHIKIYNEYTSAQTYDVTFVYEEVALLSSSGAVRPRGGFTYQSTKAVPDNTLTGIFEVTMGSDTMAGLLMFYALHVDDTSNMQVESGVLQVALYNNGGTKSTVVPTNAGTALQARSSGTLSMTWSVSNTAGGIQVELTANTSLNVAQTLYYTITNLSGQAVILL